MQFINHGALEDVRYEGFRAKKPYPWVNLENIFDQSSYNELIRNLPDIRQFKKRVGIERAYGQKSHDRYSLKYTEGVDLPEVWRAFVAELTGREYMEFLQDLFRARSVYLDLFWYYTPRGCSVSPHCDHIQKLGAQIFYLNDEEHWDEDWGGQTLILDDEGRFSKSSAPEFDDFKRFVAPPASGNRSLIFARTRHSWHGVREILCPEDRYRKIMLATIKSNSSWEVAKRRIDWW